MKEKKKGRYTEGTYLAIGLGFGVAIGVALDQLAIGISLGVAIGLMLDVAAKKKAEQENNNDKIE